MSGGVGLYDCHKKKLVPKLRPRRDANRVASTVRERAGMEEEDLETLGWEDLDFLQQPTPPDKGPPPQQQQHVSPPQPPAAATAASATIRRSPRSHASPSRLDPSMEVGNCASCVLGTMHQHRFIIPNTRGMEKFLCQKCCTDGFFCPLDRFYEWHRPSRPEQLAAAKHELENRGNNSRANATHGFLTVRAAKKRPQSGWKLPPQFPDWRLVTKGEDKKELFLLFASKEAADLAKSIFPNEYGALGVYTSQTTLFEGHVPQSRLTVRDHKLHLQVDGNALRLHCPQSAHTRFYILCLAAPRR